MPGPSVSVSISISGVVGRLCLQLLGLPRRQDLAHGDRSSRYMKLEGVVSCLPPSHRLYYARGLCPLHRVFACGGAALVDSNRVTSGRDVLRKAAQEISWISRSFCDVQMDVYFP